MVPTRHIFEQLPTPSDNVFCMTVFSFLACFRNSQIHWSSRVRVVFGRFFTSREVPRLIFCMIIGRFSNNHTQPTLVHECSLVQPFFFSCDEPDDGSIL
jgi:hypothetical protein